MKNKYLLILAIIAFALLIWVFLIPDKKKDKIRVCFPPSLIASLPHWVAMEKGFYNGEGLEPFEIPFADSKVMISSIYNNEADFLPAVSLADLFNSSRNHRDKFPPIIISHSRMKRNPSFEGLLVANNQKISTLKDLENKTIAVYPGTTSLNTIKYFLIMNGVNISSITFKTAPPPEHQELLRKGEIDCSHLYEPFRTQALLSGNTIELFNGVYPSFNEPSAIGISVISNRFYNENRETADKLVRVWNKSINFIKDNDTEARRILMNKLKISDKVSVQATWVDATITSEINQATVDATIKSLVRIGLVDSANLFQPIYYAK